MRTPVIQKTIKLLGPLFPGKTLIYSRRLITSRRWTAGVGLKIEVPKMGYKKLQYFNQICLQGPTRPGLAGPDPLLFNLLAFDIPGLDWVSKVGSYCYSGI